MFFLSVGKNQYERKEGLAADFCPICCDATAVEVRQVRSEIVVSGSRVGPVALVGRRCYCLKCHNGWALRQGTIQSVVNSAPVSVESLLANTYPQFWQTYGARMLLEAELRIDPNACDAATRRTLLTEPYFFLDAIVERTLKDQQSHGMALRAISLIVTLLLVTSGLQAFAQGSRLLAPVRVLAAIPIGWVAWNYQSIAERRFTQEIIYPNLARSLARLAPSREELDPITLFDAQKSGTKIPKCVYLMKQDDFFPVLEAARARLKEAQAAGVGSP